LWFRFNKNNHFPDLSVFKFSGCLQYLIHVVEQVTSGQRGTGIAYLEIGDQFEILIPDLDIIGDPPGTFNFQEKKDQSVQYLESKQGE
jgi:hypothetical protein